ncbi:recombination mediator RecR [Patescibacteria group bacterium]|nr:recombination mediator RecR [Patescibacteria group bacterium]MBU0777158.1 recombination mediator RecR [Patescibacteria group bacterium]MBU0845852.1 recombination mediator RecR [Patescibacteria group bacterium]MBU0922879.1 recombination mediator RecR [Patescibacteria group bacterium]MBU1066388.1 recombination mediator RecR [Patescibacteria group bacterium]
MKIPKPLLKLIESFQKLPGIGPKTAQRLTYYLLHVPQGELDSFAEALSQLKKSTILCSICRNVAETDPCPICVEDGRDEQTILVVEQPLDILAFERTRKFTGRYHVLHGSISPLENIGPDELYIDDLLKRTREDESIKEIIIATNPTMEGEATAMYISKKLKAQIADGRKKFKITRLGMGIPTGADLEYADETTLEQAIEGRRNI